MRQPHIYEIAILFILFYIIPLYHQYLTRLHIWFFNPN